MGLQDRDYYQNELRKRDAASNRQRSEPTDFAKHFVRGQRYQSRSISGLPNWRVRLNRVLFWVLVLLFGYVLFSKLTGIPMFKRASSVEPPRVSAGS